MVEKQSADLGRIQTNQRKFTQDIFHQNTFNLACVLVCLIDTDTYLEGLDHWALGTAAVTLG